MTVDDGEREAWAVWQERHPIPPYVDRIVFIEMWCLARHPHQDVEPIDQLREWLLGDNLDWDAIEQLRDPGAAHQDVEPDEATIERVAAALAALTSPPKGDGCEPGYPLANTAERKAIAEAFPDHHTAWLSENAFARAFMAGVEWARDRRDSGYADPPNRLGGDKQ